jgi:hypothetical protein
MHNPIPVQPEYCFILRESVIDEAVQAIGRGDTKTVFEFVLALQKKFDEMRSAMESKTTQ